MLVKNLKDDKFPRLSDLRIDRRTKYGNPFAIGKDGNREEVIVKYREYIAENMHLINEIRERNPRYLYCWCAPLPCHGDVIVELLDA